MSLLLSADNQWPYIMLLQVRAPWIKTFFFGEDETYIIPGVNHVTLGGSRTLSSNMTVDEQESEDIWERCVKMVPSLERAEVRRPDTVVMHENAVFYCRTRPNEINALFYHDEHCPNKHSRDKGDRT